ncbi:restriction endonuclease subunit S [Leisingera sp. XS_AS12]|uniref:restriction endonuclease subunit S n=1 Tax=Leisingera sp. XS_AS12 TaxID=3241294 RepID=UPI003512D384
MMMPIKHAAHFLNGAAFKPSDWGEEGLPILRIAQLTGKPFDNYFDGTINRGLLIKNGDLLFSWSATIDAFIWERGDAILNQHIFKVIPKKSADKTYLYYLIKAHAPRWADDDAHGSTMRHIKKESLSNKVWVPDLLTQKRIASFLDRETARIDELIAKKERLVEVLKENLLSGLERLVTPETVTLDEMIPFRWVCRITEGQVDPTHPDWADKPLIAPNHIESRTGRLIGMETAADQGAISGKYTFPKGTVLYSKIRPNLAKACVAPVDGMCSADMYPVLPDKRLRPEFLLMHLLSARFTDWATLESMRVAMPKINRETLGSYRLWTPPLELQDAATKKFFAEQSRNEALSEKVRQSISRLKEYRSALITAAVTGQIDVETYGKAGATSATLDRIEEEMQA